LSPQGDTTVAQDVNPGYAEYKQSEPASAGDTLFLHKEGVAA